MTHLTLEQLTYLTNNMATSLTLQNDASLAQGYVKVNGTTSATFTTSGITGNLTGNVTGSLTAGGSLTLATAQTASGTSVDFTGIPSWAKRITVIFDGVSTNGTSDIIIQLGDSGGIEITGYTSSCNHFATGPTPSTSTAGFLVLEEAVAAVLASGHCIITNISSNTWIQSSNMADTQPSNAIAAGNKALSSTLDQLRITTVNGTDTFDAGTINISYEG